MGPNATPYPIPSFCFRVTIPDTAVILCSEVSGLDMEMEQIVYRSGDSIIRHPHMCGLRKSGDVTLKRCRTDNVQALKAWHDAVRCNNVSRKNITIELLDEERNAVTHWCVTNAWPKKIAAAPATGRADDRTIAFETIVLAHEGVTEE